jgi:hypothetical protein
MPLPLRPGRCLNSNVLAWIGNRLSADGEVWGFVAFLLTGHLASERRSCERMSRLIRRPRS